MTAPAWAAVLDELERAIVAQKEAIRRGVPEEVPTFSPPTRLGPLPVELAVRARQLLLRSEQLSEQLSKACSDTSRELAMLQRMRSADDTPHYLDHSI